MSDLILERTQSITLLSVLKRLYHNWLRPFVDLRTMLRMVPRYPSFLTDWALYARMPGAPRLRLIDAQPMLSDQTAQTSFDPHYLYQSVWAMQCIRQSDANAHTDVGSDVRFVALLSTALPVTFVDIRPLRASELMHLSSVEGSLLGLPFSSGAVRSLSCLHVAEHVGLGRYGDSLDPLGTRKACAELARVLAPGGNLFFSVPIGRRRTCFNAHRVLGPSEVLDYLGDLHLIEFAAVDDRGQLRSDVSPMDMADAEYACGLFWFRRGNG